MGDLYSKFEKPKRVGDSIYTRTGVPPPKMVKKSGSDAPSHRIHDPMRLELHMEDERARTAGMTSEERQWRKIWVKDQNLHPDEPVQVDAVYRQLNPIRVLYRWPLDKLYVHFLRPTLGVYYGASLRIAVPKVVIVYVILQTIYYIWKYEAKDWQRRGGVMTYPDKMQIYKKQEVEERYPGATTLGVLKPDEMRYTDPNFHKRYTMLDVGESKRPW